MEVATFGEISAEFMDRVGRAVYCSAATVDLKLRPRSRMLHPVWEGSTGWVVSWPESHKAKHLAHNPHVSLAYIQDPEKPVYADCLAEWITDPAEQQRVWNFYKTLGPPLGYDLKPHYGTIRGKYFGLLRLTPWRIKLGDLKGAPTIWRA